MPKTTISFFVLIIGMLTFASSVYPEVNLDFQVPLPEQAQFVEAKDIVLGGRSIKMQLYKSKNSLSSVADYSRRELLGQGFQVVFEKAGQGPDKNARSLRFQKEDLAVNIFLRPGKINDTEIIIAKYVQAPGEPPIEKVKLSFKDSLFSYPKQDTPGRDLSFIPRPPQSVRWMEKSSSQVNLFYSSSLFVNDIRDFYKSQMPVYGWEFAREIATSEALDNYEQSTKKKVVLPKLPVEGGEDWNKVIRDSYVLDFRGERGLAQINIFPNFIDRKLGSIVNIIYSPAEGNK